MRRSLVLFLSELFVCHECNLLTVLPRSVRASNRNGDESQGGDTGDHSDHRHVIAGMLNDWSSTPQPECGLWFTSCAIPFAAGNPPWISAIRCPFVFAILL